MAERYYQIIIKSGRKIKEYETPEKELELIYQQIQNDFTKKQLKKSKGKIYAITPDLFIYYRKSKIEKILQAA